MSPGEDAEEQKTTAQAAAQFSSKAASTNAASTNDYSESASLSKPISHKQRLIILALLLAAIVIGAAVWHPWSPSSRPAAALQPAVTLSPEQKRQVWEAEDLAGQKDFDLGHLTSAKQHFLAALDSANECRAQDKKNIQCIAIGELCDVSTAMHDDAFTLSYTCEEKPLQLDLQQAKLETIAPIIQKLKSGIERKSAMTKGERTQFNEAIARANDFYNKCKENADSDLEQHISPYLLSAYEKTHDEVQAARIDVNFGSVLALHGYQKRAAALLKKGLALSKKLLPPFDPDLGRAFSFLGRAQMEWRDRDAANNLTQAYHIYCRAYGPHSSQAGSLASALAQCYRQENDTPQMRHYAEIAVQILRGTQISNPDYAGLMDDMGESYLCLGKRTDARAAFQNSVDRQETMINTRYSMLAFSLRQLQSAKMAQGEFAPAQALGARSAAIKARLIEIKGYLIPQILAAFDEKSPAAPSGSLYGSRPDTLMDN